MSDHFRGKAAIVTGGASGIGACLGRYFPGLIQRSSIRFVAQQRRLQEVRAARRTSS